MPRSFISAPIVTEPSELAETGFQYMETINPGWTPLDDQLDVWILNAVARQAAELRDVASDVPTSIFRYFGAKLMNLPPTDNTPATVTVTFTAINNSGYTIPAGYAAGVRDASGVLWGFATSADVVIPNGATTVAGVVMTATVAGAAASGLGAVNQLMELITASNSVLSVKMAGATSGGQDAEDDDVYLDRLTRDLALQAPRPILPADFVAFALNNPAVFRALALDGYDAVAGTYGNARTISVALTGDDGLPLTTPYKTAVLANLQSQREVNFLIYVIDATYTSVDVNYTLGVLPGWNSAAVLAAATLAVQTLLSPVFWANSADDSGVDWVNNPTLRYNDLVGTLYKVPGVQYVNSVTFRTGANPFATTNLTLTGPAPLPIPGIVTGALG